MTVQAFSADPGISTKPGRRASRLRSISTGAADDTTEFLQGMHQELAPDTELALARGQLLLLPAGTRSVVCVAGELWLTRHGDSEDYILGPGRRLAVGPGDQAAVQALKASRVRLTYCDQPDRSG